MGSIILIQKERCFTTPTPECTMTTSPGNPVPPEPKPLSNPSKSPRQPSSMPSTLKSITSLLSSYPKLGTRTPHTTKETVTLQVIGAMIAACGAVTVPVDDQLIYDQSPKYR